MERLAASSITGLKFSAYYITYFHGAPTSNTKAKNCKKRDRHLEWCLLTCRGSVSALLAQNQPNVCRFERYIHDMPRIEKQSISADPQTRLVSLREVNASGWWVGWKVKPRIWAISISPLGKRRIWLQLLPVPQAKTEEVHGSYSSTARPPHALLHPTYPAPKLSLAIFKGPSHLQSSRRIPDPLKILLPGLPNHS